MIAGFVTPTAGTVEMDGRQMSSRHVLAAAGEAADVDDLPELRAVAEHDGRAERRLRPEDAQGRKGRSQTPGRPDPRRGAARAPRRALSQRTLRRPAAAGVAGARAGGAAGNPAARRAAVEPRRQSARGDAQRNPPPAQRIRHHLDLRHPRPVRGDDDVGPDRRHEQGPHRADRRSPDALYKAEDALCRRIHRPLQHSRRQAERFQRRLQRF